MLAVTKWLEGHHRRLRAIPLTARRRAADPKEAMRTYQTTAAAYLSCLGGGEKAGPDGCQRASRRRVWSVPLWSKPSRQGEWRPDCEAMSWSRLYADPWAVSLTPRHTPTFRPLLLTVSARILSMRSGPALTPRRNRKHHPLDGLCNRNTARSDRTNGHLSRLVPPGCHALRAPRSLAR